ncbi:MAG: alpha/beta fold hydrolase [Pseudomonadota bacterium]|jgi:Predicted hydrolases or acyltransferases (alpha/beta hydrolase superfamily)|nr:MAG: alpha/beta hydrolase [Pseudomonadota bacterium]
MTQEIAHDALVLVPGLLCDETVWIPQREAFRNFLEVQIADHGRIDSLGGMAEAILDRAPPRFALAGHSMGGRVALEVVRRAPERVSALALLDTGHRGLPAGEAGERERAGRMRLLEMARREGMRAMGWQWLQGMIHPSRLQDRALIDPILDMIARKTPEIFEAQIRALLGRPDAVSLLPQIRCPTLVLCGREDAWSPYAQHREIAGLIPGSTLVAIPDCGHMCTLERPEAVNEALLRWLGAGTTAQ